MINLKNVINRLTKRDLVVDKKIKRNIKKDANFMEPFIEYGEWVEVDGPMGTESVSSDYVDMDEVKELIKEIEENRKASLKGTSLENYFENSLFDGIINSIEIKKGYSAYLSAPGYMDRTENVVFDTEEEALDYLKEMYPEEFEEKEEEEEIE